MIKIELFNRASIYAFINVLAMSIITELLCYIIKYKHADSAIMYTLFISTQKMVYELKHNKSVTD